MFLSVLSQQTRRTRMQRCIAPQASSHPSSIYTTLQDETNISRDHRVVLVRPPTREQGGLGRDETRLSVSAPKTKQTRGSMPKKNDRAGEHNTQYSAHVAEVRGKMLPQVQRWRFGGAPPPPGQPSAYPSPRTPPPLLSPRQPHGRLRSD